MISPVVTITKGRKEKKRIKTKTRMGSVVKKNVGEMEDNTRDGINSKIRKEGVQCVQSMVEKNILLVQFLDGQNKYMGYTFLVFLSSKEKLYMYDPLSNYPEKEQGELWIIYGNPEVR